MPVDEKIITTSTGALDLKEIPKKMIVIGAGALRSIRTQTQAPKLSPGLTLTLTLTRTRTRTRTRTLTLTLTLTLTRHVTPAGANGSPARVWHKLRGLAMSRSIGDHNAASVRHHHFQPQP